MHANKTQSTVLLCILALLLAAHYNPRHRQQFTHFCLALPRMCIEPGSLLRNPRHPSQKFSLCDDKTNISLIDTDRKRTIDKSRTSAQRSCVSSQHADYNCVRSTCTLSYIKANSTSKTFIAQQCQNYSMKQLKNVIGTFARVERSKNSFNEFSNTPPVTKTPKQAAAH